jgi:DNA-binding MarR family transcriptional regulator
MIKQLHNRTIVRVRGSGSGFGLSKNPIPHSCIIEQLHDRTFMGGAIESDQLAEQMIAFIRAFGLHRPEQTSRGGPVGASEAHALVILRHGAINHGQLARALQLQRSSVSRLVQQLAKRRWAARAVADHDRRVVFVRLTRKGQVAAEYLARARRAKFRHILASAAAGQRQQLVNALSRLAQAVSDTPPKSLGRGRRVSYGRRQARIRCAGGLRFS